MDSQMMTGNLAAAWGARLADVDYIPAFPITPQTEIVEALAKFRAPPARACERQPACRPVGRADAARHDGL